ncbi:2-hydroxyacid dehydrogenase [Actinoalloteichus caeruleus]|uniref:Phosphoglycerate dehydrogenase n=1 Tax=Actinoalloteichus caeruleus DSM 43889 TaxID=1120930 RepID=A0ABT1JCS6_ACTCY|nr:2-hydroxyacid dehydrogenase [Actinoalloteichus caeruleus]MCP2330291.1 Phosphoglycerate dehydrogenase [Actinoalloteichus caeruleus DSM 43889]
MRIVLTDPIIDRFRDVLTRGGSDGHDWEFLVGRPDEEVISRLGDAEVLVASRVSAEMAGAAPALRLVHVTGAGVDRVALDALAPAVHVCNTFHHGRSIAEYVVMAAIMLFRRVPRADRSLRAGRWESVALDPAVPLGGTLAGRTVGLVGMGEIGGAVARAASALGMRVRAVRRDPGAPVPPGVVVDRVDGQDRLPDLLASSDLVVLTVPLSAETRGLVGAAELAAMRPDAVLVNVSRGPIIDEDALYEALAERRIGGAALDVWWGHPKDGLGARGYSRPFDALDNVVMTPHHSGHTLETFAGRARDIAANIGRLSSGHPLENVVRAGVRP